MATDVFAALQTEGKLAEATTGGLIRLPEFTPHFTAQQQQQVALLMRNFRENPYSGPGRTEAEAIVSAEILAALIEQGQLVKLGDGVLFLKETYDEAVATLVAYLREHDKMTAAEARDVLGTTRKYVLPLLEHLDILKITRRIGDERVLFHPNH
jgi:selenocysteine-specific elongation factor